MKKLLFSFLFSLVVSLCAIAQDNTLRQSFNDDFVKALNASFSEDELSKMFRKYASILTPHSDVTRLTEQLRGNTVQIFPLYDFKTEKLYIDNINNLLNSSNPNQRILAYLVIASSDDTSKEDILLNKITAETKKGNLIWAGMALLYLKSNHTTQLFDFLVKNEDFADAHMIPLFTRLNKDSLQATAYSRINSDVITAKVLAAQILSVTPLNTKTEQVLKESVKNWDFNIKGYAIYSIKELQIGNLLELFKPLLDSPQTRPIAMGAMANSPTAADREYLLNLIDKQDTIPAVLLDCFYKSKNNVNVQYWLKMLYSKRIPKDYVFFVFEQPLISSDNNLSDVQDALQKIRNPNVLGELVRALSGRTDDLSVDIMIMFLKHENSTVRYWTAKTLANNSSSKINDEIKSLIDKGLQGGNRRN